MEILPLEIALQELESAISAIRDQLGKMVEDSTRRAECEHARSLDLAEIIDGKATGYSNPYKPDFCHKCGARLRGNSK